MKVINVVEIITILVIVAMLVYVKIEDDRLFKFLCPVFLLFIVALILALLYGLYPESIVAFREFLFSEI